MNRLLAAAGAVTALALVGFLAPVQSADALPASPYTATARTGLYLDTESPVMEWAQAYPSHPDLRRIRTNIGLKPVARWVGGGDIAAWVDGYVDKAAARSQLPVLVAYNIPNRDCGGQSGGGANGAEEYAAWSRVFAAAVGDRPAVLILEPDSLIHMPCLDEAGKAARLGMLRSAVRAFAELAPRTWVYVDGGDGRFNSPAAMAPWIAEFAAEPNVRGFAVNVSNYNANAVVQAFSGQLKAELAARGMPDAGYVIDTSRNGYGAPTDGQWCNPADRKLGASPMMKNGWGADALLWIKHPGVSDGDCGTGAGTLSGMFVPKLAMDLINGWTG